MIQFSQYCRKRAVPGHALRVLHFAFIIIFSALFLSVYSYAATTLIVALNTPTPSIQLKQIRKIGEIGQTKGRFRAPLGIAAWRKSIFVADKGNRRIQRISPSGQMEYVFQDIKDQDGERDRLEQPIDVVLDPSGLIYVLDAEESVIYRFDHLGVYQATLGGFGVFGVEFNTPLDLAVDNLGFLYVADTGNHRVLKIDRDGKKVMEIRALTEKLERPRAVAVSSQGDVYVADEHGVRVFNDVGAYRHTLFSGKHYGPIGLDSKGRLVLVNRPAQSVEICSTEGELLKEFSLPFLPTGMAITENRIYLSDAKQNCIWEYGYEAR